MCVCVCVCVGDGICVCVCVCVKEWVSQFVSVSVLEWMGVSGCVPSVFSEVPNGLFICKITSKQWKKIFANLDLHF